jgi:hypothetical protein
LLLDFSDHYSDFRNVHVLEFLEQILESLVMEADLVSSGIPFLDIFSTDLWSLLDFDWLS